MSWENTEKLIEDNLQNYKDSICDKEQLSKQFEACIELKDLSACQREKLKFESCAEVHKVITDAFEDYRSSRRAAEMWRRRLERYNERLQAREVIKNSS